MLPAEDPSSQGTSQSAPTLTEHRSEQEERSLQCCARTFVMKMCQNSEADLKLLLIADVHAQVIQGIQSLHSDIRFRVRKEAGDDVKTSKFTKEILEGGKCLAISQGTSTGGLQSRCRTR